jgi:hypothetical protein
LELKKYMTVDCLREFNRTKSTAYNLRFGATAAVTRMKEPCEFEKPCAAEIEVEAAAAAEPLCCVQAGESAVERAVRKQTLGLRRRKDLRNHQRLKKVFFVKYYCELKEELYLCDVNFKT